MIRLLGFFLCFVSLFSGCTSRSTEQKPAEKIVHLAIWSNYLSQEVLAQFQKETGYEVKLSHYSSNEELLAKLQAGASGYDVAVPSDYMVFAMAQLKLLMPLQQDQISNRSTLDKRFLGKSFDPSNVYSVPYDWGITGLAYRKDKVTGGVRGWKELFAREDLKGRFSLLDDAREALGTVLKSQGQSLNTRSPSVIEAAKKRLIELKPRIKAFTSEPLVSLVDGEVWAAQAYLSDSLQAAKRTQGKIEFIVPEEGGTVWIDNLVIPVGAQHLEGAHLFINFLLRPEIAAKTTQQVMVSPTVLNVGPLLPPELRNHALLFPPAAVMGKLEMMEDLGDTLNGIDRAWTEVKASH